MTSDKGSKGPPLDCNCGEDGEEGIDVTEEFAAKFPDVFKALEALAEEVARTYRKKK